MADVQAPGARLHRVRTPLGSFNRSRKMKVVWYPKVKLTPREEEVARLIIKGEG